MKAFYEVRIVNRDTGLENMAKVEATSAESARLKVLQLIEAHEIVGDARLAEVIETEAPAPVPPPQIPGVVTCPKCGETKWVGGRGCLLWAGVILLFPIGLLLLFVKPTWKCAKCRYTFQSYSAPVGIGEPKKGVAHGIATIILILLAMVGVFIVLVLLFAE